MMVGVAFILCLAGCAQLAKDGDNSANSAEGGGGTFDAAQLRIDLFPGPTNPDLANQSWLASADTKLDDMDIKLSPSVEVSGQVVGYEVNPNNAEVPGADRQPVSATVSVIRVGTLSGASVTTDDNGFFSLMVPPSNGYQFSIVPTDGSTLPFQVSSDADITDKRDLETIDLGYGAPVFGIVRDSEGSAIVGAKVALEHLATGVMGPSTTTDQSGHYLLRAYPDEYILQVMGQIGQAMPVIRLPAMVAETDGLSLDVNMGQITPVAVFGQVFDAEGRGAIRNVRVRLRSVELDYSDGRLQVETDTDRDGLFGRDLLAGAWTGEIIPEFDTPFGGVSISFRVGATRVDLAAIHLPDRVQFSSSVLDTDGEPVPREAVNAQETGFDGYVFSTSTDADGRFDLDLPPQSIALLVSPPNADLAMARVLVDPATDQGTVYLSTGELISGRVTRLGEAVRFALIEVRTLKGTLLATAFTDESGAFETRIAERKG
jgi:hypothetical protein